MPFNKSAAAASVGVATGGGSGLIESASPPHRRQFTSLILRASGYTPPAHGLDMLSWQWYGYVCVCIRGGREFAGVSND